MMWWKCRYHWIFTIYLPLCQDLWQLYFSNLKACHEEFPLFTAKAQLVHWGWITLLCLERLHSMFEIKSCPWMHHPWTKGKTTWWLLIYAAAFIECSHRCGKASLVGLCLWANETSWSMRLSGYEPNCLGHWGCLVYVDDHSDSAC